MTHLIGRGAEAMVYRDNDSVIKDRVKKSYRIDEIDQKLRKFRTRRENKILNKLAELNFPAPHVKDFCDKTMRITMEHIKGTIVRDVLDKDNVITIAGEIGKKIAFLHNNNIIHSDLTTSNMILNEDDLHIIDFGLGFFSPKVEDKAVDLHLFKQGLESKHHTIWKDAFNAAIGSYSEVCENADEILKRFKQVEERGRYKKK